MKSSCAFMYMFQDIVAKTCTKSFYHRKRPQYKKTHAFGQKQGSQKRTYLGKKRACGKGLAESILLNPTPTNPPNSPNPDFDQIKNIEKYKIQFADFRYRFRVWKKI